MWVDDGEVGITNGMPCYLNINLRIMNGESCLIVRVFVK
jgi:hypothetical protein